jgi:GPH family glycoside/pentoside/hexuronide:cation symporter
MIQLLFRLCFTIVGIPYGALSSAMTKSSDERGVLTGYRMTFSTFASLLVAVGVPPAVEWLGGASARLGYFLTASCVGCAAMLLILVCFASSREPQDDSIAASRIYRIGELPSLLTANDAFLRVAACIACQATSMAILLSGAPYFFTYVRSEPESLGPSMALLISGVALSIPIWTLVSRRIGKRATWMAGAAWAALALGLSAFVAQGPYPVFLAMVGLASIGIGAVVLTSFAMLPDTVEYGEWKTGRRVEAGLFSALVLAQKAATGFATWLIGLLLQWIEHSPQTPMTGAGAQLFGLALYLIPAALLTSSILIIRRYPLSATFHAQLVNDIAVRKRLA